MNTNSTSTTTASLDERIAQVGGLLVRSNRVVCLTGAGVSAESGIATFRDAASGYWARFDPQQLASQAGFAADSGLVWRWYMERLDAVERAQPNPGHHALARLAARVEHFTLATQNVDDLHERAGHSHVLHLHGRLHRFRCNLCESEHALLPQERRHPQPPICQQCGNQIRPDVVWFGEPMPNRIWQAAWRAAEQCQVMLVVGTSGVVYPAAQLPLVAQAQGATVVDINPDVTPISEIADYFLQGPSGTILPQLLAAMEEQRATP